MAKRTKRIDPFDHDGDGKPGGSLPKAKRQAKAEEAAKADAAKAAMQAVAKDDLPPGYRWNKWNKVVEDRDGKMHPGLTNKAREKRGLPMPWSVEMFDIEKYQPAVD